MTNIDIKTSIKIENTPNPKTKIFRFSEIALENKIDQTYNFPNAQEAEVSPLASKIFGFPWTSNVLLGPDFISITKQDWVEWDMLAEPLASLIADHLDADLPLYQALEEVLDDQNGITASDSDVIKQIKRVLNNEIRPIVAYDGGDVEFGSFQDGILYVKFSGACSGCPSKSITLKQGIEVRMKELVPEVLEVLSL